MSRYKTLFVTIITTVLCSPARADMSPQCYLDRAPGGCYELSRGENERIEQTRARYEEFKRLSVITPAAAVPSFCGFQEDPTDMASRPSDFPDITPDQMRTCIKAGQKWEDDLGGDRNFSIPGIPGAKWRDVEADNGAVFKYDAASIRHYDSGTAEVMVYAVEGPEFNPANLMQFLFDCQGHYTSLNFIGPWVYAPPRSVIGQISEITCAR